MENDIFRISFDRVLLFISQVALLTDLFEVYSVRCSVLGLSAGRLREKDLAIAELQRKLEESAERREVDEKLTKLQIDMDQELAAL